MSTECPYKGCLSEFPATSVRYKSLWIYLFEDLDLIRRDSPSQVGVIKKCHIASGCWYLIPEKDFEKKRKIKFYTSLFMVFEDLKKVKHSVILLFLGANPSHSR